MDKFFDLTYESVPDLWERREEFFKNQEIDLSDTIKVDSSGIAFLVQWSKALPQGKLKIKHPPKGAIDLIKTFSLEPLFEIEN